MPARREFQLPRPQPWSPLAFVASVAILALLVTTAWIESRLPTVGAWPARAIVLIPIPAEGDRARSIPYQLRVDRPASERQVRRLEPIPVTEEPDPEVRVSSPMVFSAPTGQPVQVDTGSAQASLWGRLRPSLGEGGLWVRPLPVPPKDLAKRIARTHAELVDSAVTAIVQGYLDSIAAQPGAEAAALPGWTTKVGGKTWGVDGTNIHIAGLKIPAAVLALIPLPVASNPTQDQAYKSFMRMRTDLVYAANRSATLGEFKERIREMRMERERQEAMKRSRRETPGEQPAQAEAERATP